MNTDTPTDRRLQLPTEARVLSWCGQNFLLDDQDGVSFSVPTDNVDWQSACELAGRHRMEFLLFKLFRDNPDLDYPEVLYQNLESQSNRVKRRNLAMSAELVRLVEKLESNGVCVLAYKGPVVASRAYGDISYRRFVDLDLLVDPSDHQSALEVLREEGYEQKIVKEQLFESILQRPDESILLDLHTRIIPRYFPFQFNFQALHNRQTEVDIGGQSVPTLSTPDAVLAHAIHGSKHRWFRVEWILAVAILIHQTTDTDALFDRAERMGCERMVLLAIVLSRELFDASFRPSIERRLNEPSQSIRVVEDVADTILDWVFTAEWASNKHDKRTHIADFRLRSKLHPNLAMKTRFWISVLTDPREDDFEFVDLPAGLSPLYRVVRPIRLLYEYRGRLADKIS
ncbi:Uncharacterised nucleotidyltransferase [Halorientalis persicus]|uniref:Uncharacterized nucleotidyltransferase n=1 Tax=Halorientalis persicus TaxID=1367881 RepID=A0A1H8SZE9_9EURY|nr:nucleotidyltransferase family protein [Halorientalis persicus]SEO83718.1 Uncharacterised nucleotidyltransferase [Halorientalis persicus]